MKVISATIKMIWAIWSGRYLANAKVIFASEEVSTATS